VSVVSGRRKERKARRKLRAYREQLIAWAKYVIEQLEREIALLNTRLDSLINQDWTPGETLVFYQDSLLTIEVLEEEPPMLLVGVDTYIKPGELEPMWYQAHGEIEIINGKEYPVIHWYNEWGVVVEPPPPEAEITPGFYEFNGEKLYFDKWGMIVDPAPIDTETGEPMEPPEWCPGILTINIPKRKFLQEHPAIWISGMAAGLAVAYYYTYHYKPKRKKLKAR